MSPLNFVFWQNILSPHQSPFIRCLAEMGYGVTVATAETMTADRLALGWKVPDQGQARVVVAPGFAEVTSLVEEGPREAIHVIAGARWTPLGNLAVKECVRCNRRVGIISEGADPRGLKGVGRWVKYTIERYAKGNQFQFVLAMGENGVRWFRRCAYPAERVFPFAYVADPVEILGAADPRNEPVFLYAGQFILRKGLDLLLQAFAAVPMKEGQLRLLGDGPEKQRLQSFASELGVSDRIRWLEKRDAIGVRDEMAKADVTILPSLHDGWGAVVNESLMAGTPVICSSDCGAAELMRQPWLGSVFRSGKLADLTRALQQWIELGTRSASERERIRQWARCISGESVAGYFSAIMHHRSGHLARPCPPWRGCGVPILEGAA